MHVLISCFGSAGDVHPFIAVGAALRMRGHRVELLASPYFRERIEAIGLTFVPVGTLEDYFLAVNDAQIADPRRGFVALWRHFRNNLRAGYERIVERADADSVLVGSTLAWSSRIAQEKLKLRAATVHLSPGCLFSGDDPAVMPYLGWLRCLPPWLVRRLQRGIEGGFIDPVVLPDLNALRAELGLPPVCQVMSRWEHSPQGVICAFPDWFAAAQTDWPMNSVTTDFPRWNATSGTALDPALEAFLQAGTPPIGMTPGSAMAHARPLFANAIAACARLGRRAVLVTPFPEQLPRELPPFVYHVAYAPFDLLLPRLAALVHHGGIGTLAQCLAAGVPQLIAPFAFDQFDNAARLRKLGAGISIAPTARAATWLRALHALAQSDIQRTCEQLAMRMRAAPDAAERIATHVEAIANRAEFRGI
jgi:rhamnosyltransferase subunit B